ncbi:MAG: NUDIX domain-containing protein [Lachnospiraceae bacterium]|nr:NUDIX domain-containing protein [Lachnospiraceae bacterium]
MEKKEITPELLDVLDCNGIPTGKIHVRGTGAVPGEYTGAVVVCVINSRGEMLIQQRVQEKQSWGGLWDVSCGGAICQGETPQIAAMREIKEELGLEIHLDQVRPSIVTLFSNGFSYTFVVKQEPALESLVLQREEVQDVRYATAEEIKDLIEKEEFVPYRTSWIDYVFDFARQEFVF